MKKFKKSAVVIPALARIAVTAAASVSGTVAWFTATHTVTATAGNFNATYNDGNLELSVASVQATEGDQAVKALTINDHDVTIDNGIHFTDASYNATANELWSDKEKDDGTDPTEFESKGGSTNASTGWVADLTYKTLYAVTWTYTFKYRFGTDVSKDAKLAFDPSLSSMTCAADNTFSGVSGGFRRAMTCDNTKTNTKTTIIYAPESATIFTYIKDANGTKETYGTTCISSNKQKDNTKYELGTFKAPSLANSYSNDLAVRVVAWFEGTDTTHTITNATLASVSAQLGFNVAKVTGE